MFIVWNMATTRSAQLNLVAGDGHLADLGWLHPVKLFPGVRVDALDLGWRLDLIVTKSGEEVTIFADLHTGERVVNFNGAPDSPLVQLALMLALYRTTLSEVVPPPSPQKARSMRELARQTESIYLRADEGIEALLVKIED